MNSTHFKAYCTRHSASTAARSSRRSGHARSHCAASGLAKALAVRALRAAGSRAGAATWSRGPPARARDGGRAQPGVAPRALGRQVRRAARAPQLHRVPRGESAAAAIGMSTQLEGARSQAEQGRGVHTWRERVNTA